MHISFVIHILKCFFFLSCCEFHHILFKEYGVHIKIKILWKMMHRQVSMVSDTVDLRCTVNSSFLFFVFFLGC